VQQIGTSLPLILLWLTAIIGVPCALVAGYRWVGRRVKAARLRRGDEAQRRREVMGATRCMCWETSVILDEVAHAYGERHLVRLQASSPALDRLRSGMGSESQVLVCPNTGALWLSAAISPEGATLLLRGPVLAPEEPRPDAPIGFYL